MLNRSACNVSSLCQSILQSLHLLLYVACVQHTRTRRCVRCIESRRCACMCMPRFFPSVCMGDRPCPISHLIFANALAFLRARAACACWRVSRSDGSGLLPSLCSAEVQLGLFTKLRSGVTRSSPSDTQVVIKVTSRFPCVSFMTA